MHKNIFGFCFVSLNIPIMHGYGTIYVSISVFSARCQVTLPLRPIKTSCIQTYSLFRPWRIQRARIKKSDSAPPSGFHSLMDGDNNVIYGLCRRNMLIHFSKFHFLYDMLVINFSEKRPVGFSRPSKGPIAINSLWTPNLADCSVKGRAVA